MFIFDVFSIMSKHIFDALINYSHALPEQTVRAYPSNFDTHSIQLT